MRVVVDVILKKYEIITATFVEQFPFKSSSFLDKNSRFDKNEGIKKIETLYYKVVVKHKGTKGFTVLTSTEYFDLQPGTKYSFVFGKYGDINGSVSRAVIKADWITCARRRKVRWKQFINIY